MKQVDNFFPLSVCLENSLLSTSLLKRCWQNYLLLSWSISCRIFHQKTYVAGTLQKWGPTRVGYFKNALLSDIHTVNIYEDSEQHRQKHYAVTTKRNWKMQTKKISCKNSPCWVSDNVHQDYYTQFLIKAATILYPHLMSKKMIITYKT